MVYIRVTKVEKTDVDCFREVGLSVRVLNRDENGIVISYLIEVVLSTTKEQCWCWVLVLASYQNPTPTLQVVL